MMHRNKTIYSVTCHFYDLLCHQENAAVSNWIKVLGYVKFLNNYYGYNRMMSFHTNIGLHWCLAVVDLKAKNSDITIPCSSTTSSVCIQYG